ncbi:hypothetical protein K491DRAFT_710532 [Lophiostoma macrostomum CBS 122681]|uniref:Uncharacterized protein n=1 Tax=Lophiostoma macrostomum CBS 122681 TaxID=1314788 RepID=A0A6A6TQU9_9PLEO|nr:hypothetical protein K491DRAFT_710532 [Lophiostoma macrostomum CBS 122681]
MDRVLDDGSTALHLAAQICINPDVLDYLCDNGCEAFINRADQFGWTPLHYAVMARSSAQGDAPFAKVGRLLQRGADAEIRVVENALSLYDQPSSPSTALELLRYARPERFDLLVGTLTGLGLHCQ